MASKAVRDIGTVRDIHGYVIRVGVDHDTVTIGGAAYVMLAARAREDFQRLFMEAERQAEAHAAPAVSETEVPGA